MPYPFQNQIRIESIISLVASAVLGFATNMEASATQVRETGRTVEDINRLVVKGRLEVQQRKYDQAILDFSAALQMKPSPTLAAEIHGERGGAYVDKGELDKALADGEEAVRLAPGYFRGYQVRGRVFRHRKKLDRAISEFDKALQLAPNFAQLYNNRGNAFDDKGQHDRAIQDFSEAIRRAPQTLDGYVNRGGSYITIGQFDKAITDLNQALRINPRDSDSYYNRGLARRGKKNYPSAIADFTKANELSSHDPAILNSIAWLRATCPLDALRNGREALEASLEACGLTGWQDTDDIDTLAVAYAEVGDFERAIQYTTKVLNMKIDTADRKNIEKRLALYRDHKPYRESQVDKQSRAHRS